jgi:hypothetical protein
MDADTSARDEETDNLDIARIHQLDEVVHDDVHAVLMEVAVVAKREEVQLETLALHHALVGDIENLYLGEVGLPSDGAERGELGAVELHPVVALGMAVFESLEHLRGIGLRYLGLVA